MEQFKSFLDNLRTILSPDDIHIDDADASAASSNSLSIARRILGLATPRTFEQLRLIVIAAANFRVPIYPVSRGKNVGYGDMSPVQENQFIINLQHMNSIREYDETHGEVVVEPGVSQGQLARFLRENGGVYMADVTGATPDASIIGNTLEAGFGHTPLGDHRKNILEMEILLADGSVLRTEEMPVVGPDLAQLFIQSNFGIVTALRIPIYPTPEKCLTYTISFESDSSFFRGVSCLKELRKRGVITSLVHSANATRTLMTSSRFPAGLDPAIVLSDEDCLGLYNERSLIKIGAWTSIGAFYGSKSEVRAKAKSLASALRGVGKVEFFSDLKIDLLDSLLKLPLIQRMKSLELARKSFASLKALHGILRGEPSSEPSENIYWRITQKERLGLMWFAPVVPANPEDIESLLRAAREIYAKYGFEMAVTFTLITSKKMTAVFSISFDKCDPREVERAHRAYAELSSRHKALGYHPYRLGIMGAGYEYDRIKAKVLTAIKRAMDPLNILAPGRYGLDLSRERTDGRPYERSSVESKSIISE